MKKLSWITALLAFPLITTAEDFQISVERQKKWLPEKGGKGEKGIDRSMFHWSGEIKIENRMQKPSPELEAKYILFVKRQAIGQKVSGDTFEQVKGSAKVPVMRKMEATSVKTEEVDLHHAQVAQGFYLKKGGQVVTNDSVSGVWVKLFSDGNEVAEYTNPPSLKTRFKFE